MEASVGHEGQLGNFDLDPTTEEQRTWTWIDFTALWVGMAHNIPTWLMAGSLIALGLNWWQATLIIALGNLIVLVPIILNSHPGTKYGIPFPVIARASFGIRGANLATIVRGGVAAIWFGIQLHVGAQAMVLILTRLSPGLAGLNRGMFLYQGGLDWICFIIFLGINLLVLLNGMAELRRFERWAAPSVLVLAVILFIWAWKTAGGLGPLVDAPPTQQINNLGEVLIKSLMSVIGFWATLSLNASDFTRFARSQRDQIIGQTLGMPTTMIVFSVLGVLTTSATAAIFGHVVWDAVVLVKQLPSTALVVVCLLAIVLATLSVNVPANLVSASYDISNLSPKRISMWRGAEITAVIATVIMPWRLLATAQGFVFDLLGTIAILLAPVAGILIADYWWVRRCELSLPDLYNPTGIYRYVGGVNPKAFLAVAFGILTSYSGHLLPSLQILSNMSWITGFLVAMITYAAMMGRESGVGAGRALQEP